IVPSKTDKKTEQDSLGNVSKITKTKILNKDEAPSEPDQMQFHKGIDVAVAYGSDVKCTAKGKVIFAGNKGGYGNCVIVQHGNGLSSLYAHLSEILVSANQEVKVGEVIAKSGNSGRSTGPHLHYEVHKNNTPVNPKLFLSL
ncbi:MAG: M23 family metallopeptidase, partial [Cloacibacterium sp.]|nr:M23 family metallopeptidase [Cloacibacterium sp.]